ncbi:ParA family protein [Candidatus Spongiihabitans sp.]|uniref:ParA family protein n=1 Tax=Candidatus Spongiihabitans sp. TaxID=3101308 RepID=UPI003C6F0817
MELFSGYAVPTKNKPASYPLDAAGVIKQVSSGWLAKWKLGVIPSRFDFSDNLVRATKMDERVLAKFIARHMQHKDLILIDCAPTESIFTKAAYHASRYVLIPVKLEFFSTIGFPLMKQSLESFRTGNRGHTIDVCGVLVHRTKTSGYGSSADGRDSLIDIRKKAKDYKWDIFTNRMDHSDAYPRWAKDPYAGYLGNAGIEWPDVAKEILAKIDLGKQEKEQ